MSDSTDSHVILDRVDAYGWSDCVRLRTDVMELVAPVAVGPRILRFAAIGEANLLLEHRSDLGTVGGDEWRLYGGHRLWHGPEHAELTYVPDNEPVRLEVEEGPVPVVHLVQEIEAGTGIEKSLRVALDPDGTAILLHRLTNRSSHEVTLAPWALTALAPSGTAVVPLPPRGVHPADLLPDRHLVLWPYTDLGDPRWSLGRDMVRLRALHTDAEEDRLWGPQKLGLAGELPGWSAYLSRGWAFVKAAGRVAGPRPDLGSAIELFVDDTMLELETLGPLTDLPPGGHVEHVEAWQLVRTPAVMADGPDEVVLLDTLWEVGEALVARATAGLIGHGAGGPG